MKRYGMNRKQFEDRKQHMIGCLEATKMMINSRHRDKILNDKLTIGDSMEQEYSCKLIDRMIKEIEEEFLNREEQ